MAQGGTPETVAAAMVTRPPLAPARVAALDGEAAPVSAAGEPPIDLVCSVCGYGVSTRSVPLRCPMCGSFAWAYPARGAFLRGR